VNRNSTHGHSGKLAACIGIDEAYRAIGFIRH
jgi:hypothetical protein